MKLPHIKPNLNLIKYFKGIRIDAIVSGIGSVVSGPRLAYAGNALTAYWKKLVALAITLLGLSLYFGAQYGLGSLISSDGYMIAIGVLIGVAVLVVTIAYPFWGYVIWFFATRYVNLFTGLFPARYNFDFALPGLIIVVLFARALCKKIRPKNYSFAELTLIIFFVYAYIVRKEPEESLIHNLKYLFLSPAVFYYITKNIITERRHIYWLMIVFIATGVSFALMGIYEQYSGKMWLAGILGGDRGLYGEMRSTGPAGHYYVYGNMLIITIILCMHILKWQKCLLSKLTVLISMSVSFLGLYYGFSRAPYIAFIISIIVMMILAKRTKTVYAASLIMLLLAAAVLVPIASSDKNIHNRMTTTIDARLATNLTSISMFKHNLLFGVGRDKYVDYVPEYVSGMMHSSRRFTPGGLIVQWGNTHSEYFLMLTELGIIGMTLYALVYILYTLKIFKLRNALSKYDIDGSDFAAVIIAFTIGVLFTMITDEYGRAYYMYAILFTLYAMVIKSDYYYHENSDTKTVKSLLRYE